MRFAPQARASAPPPAIRLELSGPKLALALQSLVAGAEDTGGVERYVESIQLKSRLFAEALGEGRARHVPLADFRNLCAFMSTVRRRIGHHVVEPGAFERLRERVATLLDPAAPTSATDARVAEFCAAFPDDRAHRWVRDLAAELLHHVEPERYPLMTRWMWDARANTGVLREIWHAEDVDHMTIPAEDGYDTFVTLREELAQFLASNAVYRDVVAFVDLLAARVYAMYIQEQGGSYLRADFSSAEEPMMHIRRLLGLDGIADNGRTRLKAADGTAVVVDQSPRLT